MNQAIELSWFVVDVLAQGQLVASVSTDPLANQARIGELNHDTEYEVRVRIANELGVGPYATLLVRTLDLCPLGTFSSSESGACVPCIPGTYASQRGLVNACSPCPGDRKHTRFEGATALRDCLPDAGKYLDAQNRVAECPRGADCTTLGSRSVETLLILPGFWRPVPTTSNIFACRRPTFCVGGSQADADAGGRRELAWMTTNVSEALCSENHVGPLCEACVPGYKIRNETVGCVLCTDEARSADVEVASGVIVGLLLILLLAAVAVVFVQLFFISPLGPDGTVPGTSQLTAASDTPRSLPLASSTSVAFAVPVAEVNTGSGVTNNKQDRGTLELLSRQSSRFQRIEVITHAGVARLEIVLGMFQVARGFAQTFDGFTATAQLPLAIRDFVSGIAVLATLDVSDFIVFGCSSSLPDHYSRLLLAMVAPLVLLLSLCVLWLALRVLLRTVYRASEAVAANRLGVLSQTMATLLLFTIFLCYPSSSATILRTFACKSFEDGSKALLADLSIDCNSPEHSLWSFVAVVGVILYPIGVPVLLWVLLWRHRGSLRSRANEREVPKRALRLAFLWRPYRNNYWFYEVVALIIRLVQVSLIQFLWAGEALQPAAAMVLCMAAGILVSIMHPYATPDLNLLSILCQSTLQIVALAGLLGFTEVGNVGTTGEAFLFVILVLPLVIALGQLVLVVIRWRDEIQ